jgi:hypothetical protein
MRVRLVVVGVAAGVALLTACSSGDSTNSSSAALDQEASCEAWAAYLASPESATPTPPTAMESEQFMSLSDAYGVMADQLAPLAGSLDGSVDATLQDALTRAAETTADISSLSATVAETLAPSDLEALIPLMDAYSAQIEEITAICTAP